MKTTKHKAALKPARQSILNKLIHFPVRVLTLPFRMARSHQAMKLLREQAISVQLVAFDNGRGANEFDCHINHQPWCESNADPAKAVLLAYARWGSIRHWRKPS